MDMSGQTASNLGSRSWYFKERLSWNILDVLPTADSFYEKVFVLCGLWITPRLLNLIHHTLTYKSTVADRSRFQAHCAASSACRLLASSHVCSLPILTNNGALFASNKRPWNGLWLSHEDCYWWGLSLCGWWVLPPLVPQQPSEPGTGRGTKPNPTSTAFFG